MISLKKWYWIVLGSVLSMALWTFISVNTGLFYAKEDSFDYFIYLTSYILVIGFWALVVADVKISDTLHKVISVAIFALTPFFCMQIAMILSGAPEYSFGIYFINVMFYFAIMLVVMAISRSMRISSIVTVVISYLFNTASFVVNILRGTPLIPGDFLAIGTAAQVAENYEFEMQYPIIATTVIAALVIALAAKFSFKLKFKYKNIIIPTLSAAIVVIFMLSLSSVDYTSSGMDVFDQYHANNTHGTLYSFYINVRKMVLQKPEGYSAEEAKALLPEKTNYTLPPDAPNIIVIMNESFADLKAVGDFATSEDYMPFVHDLKRNTVKGELLVSPFGGYTCNTEFEFLTGLSMGLLPNGSAPYLQYASKPYTFALPNHLSELGYKTVALHPYYARCWNRKKVYDLMGFDEFVSLDNLDDLVPKEEWEYIRFYISDRTVYKGIINTLEEKKDGEKTFIFNVTMQNHGGYTYGGGEFPTVTISDMEGHYKETEQYLSLIKESDDAFKELVDYLKNYDEHTIVVMFGDHQPAVEQQFYEELYGKPLHELSAEELQKRYKVPFVLWANYDIENSTDGVKTSPNYLANLVLDTAKIEKTAIGNFTSKISADIPQINGMGHYDKDGVWSRNVTETSKPLHDYNIVEYYSLKNKDNQ